MSNFYRNAQMANQRANFPLSLDKQSKKAQSSFHVRGGGSNVVAVSSINKEEFIRVSDRVDERRTTQISPLKVFKAGQAATTGTSLNLQHRGGSHQRTRLYSSGVGASTSATTMMQ